MIRPVIGIIGNFHIIGDDYQVQAIGMMNLDAVYNVAGGLPLMVPANPHFGDIETLMHACDGFLFTGGRPNVHPGYYHEAVTPAHGTFDQCRDELVLPLIRACVDRGLPVLGICRGFQEFNVAFGGSLYPEIRDLPGRMNHRMPPDGTTEEKFALRHSVEVHPDSIFAELFGANEVQVNSLHGQGIKVPGERVLIEGYAPDTTPEAIRINDAPGYALAVQWHPEWNAANDLVSRALFESFGAAARAWHTGKRPALQAKSA